MRASRLCQSILNSPHGWPFSRVWFGSSLYSGTPASSHVLDLWGKDTQDSRNITVHSEPMNDHSIERTTTRCKPNV